MNNFIFGLIFGALGMLLSTIYFNQAPDLIATKPILDDATSINHQANKQLNDLKKGNLDEKQLHTVEPIEFGEPVDFIDANNDGLYESTPSRGVESIDIDKQNAEQYRSDDSIDCQRSGANAAQADSSYQSGEPEPAQFSGRDGAPEKNTADFYETFEEYYEQSQYGEYGEAVEATRADATRAKRNATACKAPTDCTIDDILLGLRGCLCPD